MPRLALVLSLLVFAALPAAAGAKVRKGPSGRAFYTPPRTLVAGAHGSLIWARGRRLLYRSTGVDGKRVAVSGTLQVPKGRPPRGGWPLITWAHGTTGIADRCAPSRGRVGSGPALLERWRKAGYAIVKTDYVGLGTPGGHPYLIGKPEGYSVLDAARAQARQADRQARADLRPFAGRPGGAVGGVAGGSYTPDLKLRGTVAFAPASHISEQAAILPSFTQPSPLSGLVAMILRGLDIGRPELGVSAALSDAAAPLYPRTQTECVGTLLGRTSFGALAPSTIIRPGTDFGPPTALLSQLVDPEDLRIRGSVRIEQGTADAVVFQPFTDARLDYEKLGNEVTYVVWKDVDHGGIVSDPNSVRDATKYVRQQLR